MNTIFLDHNSTTPMLPEVAQAMLEIDRHFFGNPSSAHSIGRAARRHLEEAREGIAQLLQAQPTELIFTSGATEANNLALFGTLQSPGEILAAPIEHPCIIEPLKQLESDGFTVKWLPVTPRGIVETASVIQRCNENTRLICLMLANHETGSIQPVRHVAKTRPKTVLVHTDATQAVGKIPIQFTDLGVSSLSFSGHKLGGPKGIGGLLVKTSTKLKPQVFGGHQQKGYRPGTEPVALVVGLFTALTIRHKQMSENRRKLEELRAHVWRRLSEEAAPVILNGPEIGASDSLPSTLNLSFPGCRADLLLVSFDLVGVACSTGSACSSGSLLPSTVIQSLGVSEDVLRSAIRLSFCPEQELATLDEAINRIIRAVRNSRQARQFS
jgi:cysteine desulfurase